MTRPNVFIAHERADSSWVRAFASALQEQGVRVWLDEWEVPAGEPLGAALEKALRSSDIITFVVTAESVQSPNLLFEVGAALGMGKRIVPILPEGVTDVHLPYPLRARRFLLKGTPAATARKLLEEIGLAKADGRRSTSI
jgi:hypothetical protein